jgi:hypothetical protein
MSDCVFDDIHSTSEGGVLHMDGGGHLSIENTNFASCYSKCGGVIYNKVYFC